MLIVYPALQFTGNGDQAQIHHSFLGRCAQVDVKALKFHCTQLQELLESSCIETHICCPPKERNVPVQPQKEVDVLPVHSDSVLHAYLLENFQKADNETVDL